MPARVAPACRAAPAAPSMLVQVAAVTPPVDDWAQAVQGFGVPEAVAKDLANMVSVAGQRARHAQHDASLDARWCVLCSWAEGTARVRLARLFRVQSLLRPLPSAQFFFYTAVDMRALRPLDQTASLHPGVQRLEAWLEKHKAKMEGIFA